MPQLLVETSPDLPSSPGVRPLQKVLREVEPAAILVPPWLLQNVIWQNHERGESRLSAGHRKLHVVDRQHFLQMTDEQRWGIPPSLPQTPKLILLARPEIDWMAQRQWPEVLRHYWQLLFHARVHIELCRTLLEQGQGDAPIQNRIECIGRSAFHEACFVLQREHSLATDADPGEAYVEFATGYLELYHFRRDLLPIYFPAIGESSAVLATLRDDINDADVFAKTCLPGATLTANDVVGERQALNVGRALPAAPSLGGQCPPYGEGFSPGAPVGLALEFGENRRAADEERDPSPRETRPTAQIQRPPRRTLRDADREAAAGNHVGAAILRRRITLAAGNADADASPDRDALLARLTAALKLGAPAQAEWRSALVALLNDAAHGWWNPDGRLLYDLQKICPNYERELYSVSVIDWLLEFCRRPLRRPQPNQRVVLMCKALRSAARRVSRTQLDAEQQLRLTRLIDEALHQTQSRLRISLRPVIASSLTAAGLCPHNAPERVAENKVIEELLDGLEHRGFLTLGRVRDVIAANQIKFDDIPSAHAFFTSDPLFKIDRQLSDNLDGVYHRGEIYLRFFQKVSSALFATNIGRFITRTVLIPIGGSFILVEAFDHTLFLLFRLLTGWNWYKLSQLEEFRRDSFGLFLLENMTFVVMSIMLFGAVNFGAFRAATFAVLRAIGRGLGHLFIDAPRWIAGQPLVQAIAKSRAARFTGRYIAKPLLIAGVAALLTPHRAGHNARSMVLGVVFIAANLLLNSRAGRALEQVVLHWLRVIGAHVTSDILGNMFSLVTHFFARRLEDFDRMLYAVDEWLRFRHGQPHSALLLKATLGVFWFYVAYFARFAVNLLVEPQINPIKHFPVVTVSHKIVLPTVGLFAQAIEQLGISTGRARTLAACIVTTIPGIFGFLAWELRSNWKLYRANRPPTLKPVPIGSHGETMKRLLRPGFHSGTVPKIFARLRRAQLNQSPGSAVSTAHKQAEEHVAEAVAHFIDREFIFRLNEHVAWTATPISLANVRLGPTRISIDILCPALSPELAGIFFEQRAGWILAGIDRAAWIGGLDSTHAALFSAALLGLYKIAGVDVVKEQIEQLFGPHPLAFDISREQLTVWADRKFDVASIYPIVDDDAEDARTSIARKILLKFVEIEWDEWVSEWEPTGTDFSAGGPWATRVLPVDASV